MVCISRNGWVVERKGMGSEGRYLGESVCEWYRVKNVMRGWVRWSRR